MSEPKIISPLLDGFSLGNPMNEHDGVKCCPAIKENTDKKYIVKIITIPATQAQLDAMLLAGAYKDPADAMAYYSRVGEEVMKEAELLKKLSKLEGFLSYEGWQMEPITKKRLGYEVYLVSSYKRSLDKYVRKNPVTHLEAINLGLDLCAALNVCRQAGALYVDLKPANIFVSEKKEYRIGDLGFIDLDALHYSALPDKYRSAYTPPEALDPLAPLNLTIDSYAVGMILYQLYNDGQLPAKDWESDAPIPTPINADYELAEIIMKAIDPDPEKRWQEPSELGKALASYMQRNSINDTPITPHTPLDVKPEDMVPVEETTQDSQAPEDTKTAQTEEPSKPSDETADAPAAEDAEEPAAEESAPEADETVPDEADAETLMPHEMSEELSRIMAKADDLIAHETPEGVVIPEVPELPDPFAFATEDSDEVDDSDIPLDPVMEDPEEKKQKKKKKKTFASQKGKKVLRKILSTIATVLVLLVIAMAAFAYYQFFYLQSIDGIHIDGDKNQLTVTIDSDADPSLLTITCSDHYGNVKTQGLLNGQATFTELLPNTMYTIELEIEGFHKLVGQTSDIFTTDATTNIVSFNAVTGTKDGTVMLSFTVDGEEPDNWKLRYSAEGEDEEIELFTGHTVTIDDLSVGKLYTFTLDAGDELSLSGASSLEFLASRLILAEELTVTSTGNSDMTVHWKAPGDIVVDSWDVRCYNDTGYEEQLTVNDTSVYLTGIDPSVAYTVEVTASGMTQPARASITANPINITGLTVDDSAEDQLKVTWDYDGANPEGGWLLIYSMDGGNSQSVVKTKTASAVVTPKIPDAKYLFTIQSQDGTSIFGNVQTYICPSAESYEGNGLTAADVEGMLVKTPEQAVWHFGNVGNEAVTDQFKVGEKISAILHGTKNFYLPGERIETLYVIRDAYGNVLPDLVAEETNYWKEIWFDGDYHYAELDIPKIPTKAGDYVLSIYFNGMSIAEITFTLTE